MMHRFGFTLGLLILLALPGAAAPSENAGQKQQRLNTSLITAVRERNLPQARLLLLQGANPNFIQSEDIYLDYVDGGVNSYQGTNESSPLWVAVTTRQPAMIRLLLERGANPGMHGERTGSAICLAVETQQQDVVTLFLARGTLPGCLVEAVMSNNPNMVRQLLAAGLDPSDGLEAAIELPDPGIFYLLLDHGAKFQKVPETLWAAINRDDLTLLRLLLSGSQAAQDPVLMTDALDLALGNGKLGTAQFLLAYIPHIDSHSRIMWRAIDMQNLPMIQELLARGANPDLVTQDFWQTPLLEFAAHKDFAIVEVLYAHGAHFRPEKAMLAAAMNPDPRMVTFFWEHGAAVDTPDCPICMAASLDHRKNVAFLLAKGADIEALNTEGGFNYRLSALTAASLYAKADMVEYLLERGADVSRSGNLILRIVREHPVLGKYWTIPDPATDPDWQRDVENYGRLIRLFVARGLSIDAFDQDETALMAAVKSKAPHFVKILLDAGAHPGIKNAQGQTALDLARIQGLQEIISLLKGRISQPQHPASGLFTRSTLAGGVPGQVPR